MYNSSLLQAVQTVGQLLWPLFAAIMVVAAVLFVRADPRVHTICLLIGYSIYFLLTLWSLILFLPVVGLIHRHDTTDPQRIQKIFAMQQGVRFIGQVLVGYGLLMIAVIQFRKSRLTALDTRAD